MTIYDDIDDKQKNAQNEPGFDQSNDNDHFMKYLWSFELPPMEEETSLFGLYPKVTSSLNTKE